MVPEVPAGGEKYLNPLANDHGSDGQVLPFLYQQFRSVKRMFKRNKADLC